MILYLFESKLTKILLMLIFSRTAQLLWSCQVQRSKRMLRSGNATCAIIQIRWSGRRRIITNLLIQRLLWNKRCVLFRSILCYKRLLFTKKKKLSFIPICLKEDEQFFLLRRNMLNINDHNYKILICKYITSD